MIRHSSQQQHKEKKKTTIILSIAKHIARIALRQYTSNFPSESEPSAFIAFIFFIHSQKLDSLAYFHQKHHSNKSKYIQTKSSPTSPNDI